jgi:hypothetical protein
MIALLSHLHAILQVVMGWENYHLHMFKIAGQIYGDPEVYEIYTRMPDLHRAGIIMMTI